jgi:DNA-binding XRE family transcriptional regulator
MPPIDKLAKDLQARFPEAEIETRKADDPDGFQFLNLQLADLEVAVEWKKDEGFGLSSFGDTSDELSGLFEAPDEWYSNPEAVFHRIISLILDHKSTKPEAVSIPEVRHERGMSQEKLSEALQVRQATYSKLERRGDVKVSSLKKVIEAMGGRLRIQAVFPDTREIRDLTFR